MSTSIQAVLPQFASKGLGADHTGSFFDFTKNYVEVRRDYELIPTTATDFLTVVRNSTATFWNANGELEIAPTNTLRFNHDPVTKQPLGLLVEGQRTNLLNNNDTLVGTGWVPILSPDLTTEPSIAGVPLVRLTKTVQNVAARWQKGVTLPIGVYSWSIFVGRSSGRYSTFTLTGTTGLPVGSKTMRFDWETETLSIAQLPIMFTKKIAPDLFWIGGTYTVEAESLVYFRLLTQAVDDNVGDYSIFGLPQIETGPHPSSPIITGASQVTRAKDDLSILLSNLPWDDAEGSVLLEFDYTFAGSSVSPSSRRPLSIYSSGTNRHVFLNSSGHKIGVTTQITGLGTVSNLISGGSIAADTKIRLAYGFKINDFAIAVNGDAPITNLSGAIPTGLTTVSIGSDAAGNHVFGHIRQLAVIPKRRSNSELQVWSTN